MNIVTPVDTKTRQRPLLYCCRLEGRNRSFPDIRMPLEEVAEPYGVNVFDIEAAYQDITVPLTRLVGLIFSAGIGLAVEK